jgi:hypothetical protein
MNKKALSDVIAEVLLISLTIAAIGVVGYLIMPMIKSDTNLSPVISCIDLKSSSPLTIQDTCFNQQTKDIELKVARIAKDLDINELSFTIKSNNDIKSFICNSNCTSCEIIQSGKVKTYLFSYSGFNNPTSLTISINGCETNNIEINKVC